MRTAGLVALVALAALCAPAAHAHPFAPSLLELRLHADGRASLTLRAPLIRAQDVALTPVVPSVCRQTGSPRVERDALAQTLHLTLDCGAESLAGFELGLDGLRESATNALVRVEFADGAISQAVIDGQNPVFRFPARVEMRDTIAAYLRLGLGHILGGLDHLLFVAGLVLLVGQARALLATVSAFTLGHALTLCAAALELVRVPTAPVEVAIAASVFWLALELASPGGRSARPTRLAGAFGLLHGFGFAAALSEAGLPASDVLLALASFNVGIELGQLAIVAVLLLFVRSLRAYERPLAYAFGAAAGFWLIERSLFALGFA